MERTPIGGSRKTSFTLDLAGGTGDIGLNSLKRGGGITTIADLNIRDATMGQKNYKWKI